MNQYLKISNTAGYCRPIQDFSSNPFDPGRDPVWVSNLVGDFIKKFDCNNCLKGNNISNIWPEVVGDFGARNTEVVEITRKGELVISCLSRAIALSFRVYSEDIIKKLNDRYPGLNLEKLIFVPPESRRGYFGPKLVRNVDKHYE
ncbi:DciA family protein [Tropheryma whipplei]|uniref:DciA family protein n=1 Tax=Tropheryma whipplei TaxID=2039 RepID=UPI00053B9878|nr:DciA family protein [Tropheryma whipplei]